MYKHQTEIRVRYGETDQMGFVYYGNYPLYYEVGRVEALRSLGLNYSKMEEEGVALPVRELKINYYKPAFYDQFLRMETWLEEMPKTRIRFHHHIYNEENVLLNYGEVELVFMNIATKRPVICPENLRSALEKYF